MKIRLTTPTWKVCATLFASALLVLSFQNCGKAGFDSGLDEAASTSPTDAALLDQFGKSDAEKVQAIPFAYDTVIDQISYNSCADSSLANIPGFYTFKVGAYKSTSGVKLRDDFMTYVNKNFKPIADAKYLSALQIKNFLAASPENKKARPQFAIRGRGAPQAVKSPNQSLAPGIDYINLVNDLTNDRYMDPLVQAMVAMQGVTNPVFAPTQYFPMGLVSAERRIEAELTFNQDEGWAQTIRNQSQQVQLAITYTQNNAGDDYLARYLIDSTEPNKVYGRGYNMVFSLTQAPFTIQADWAAKYAGAKTSLKCANGSCNLVGTNPNRFLTSITETNLESSASSTGVTWTCDAQRRYVIMRAEDAAGCPAESFNSLYYNLSATSTTLPMTYDQYRTELEIVRRALPADQWDVNIQFRCAVPKVGKCYPDEMLNGALVPIAYDQTESCYQGVVSGSNGVKRCAHYLSICTRN